MKIKVDFYVKFKIGLIIIAVITLISCDEKNENQKNAAVEKPKNNKTIVSDFVNNNLLKNVSITTMYPPDEVVKVLGKILDEKIEERNIDYEGIKGKSIRKIEFDKYYAIIYQLENGKEIFGYLQLKENINYGSFSLGSDIRDYVNLNGDSINKWDDENLSIYGKFKNDWDLTLSCKIDKTFKIIDVDIVIGGI